MVKFLDLRKINERHSEAMQNAFKEFIESGWYILGESVKEFENEYAKYCGSRFCIGVANGLDALTLILRAYKEMGQIQDGDEIIVPSNTYIATILSITQNNLIPVLAEPDINTYNLNAAAVREKLTSKTKAVLTVHLYGRPAVSDELIELIKQHKLLLIEDAAQSQGARFKNKTTGSIGHAAAHSFYPGKNLGALGDAGAITTDDEALATCLTALRNYGSHIKYKNAYKGVNSRLDELQAKLLSIKLKVLDEDNKKRNLIADTYLRNITNDLIVKPVKNDQNYYSVWHLFVVRVQNRDKFIEHLSGQSIDTFIHYPIPPHKQTAYKEWKDLEFPISETLHREVVSLPISPVLTNEEVIEVVNAVNSYNG